MNTGYIKLYRTLAEKSFYNKPDYIIVWIHLLLQANYKESSVIYKGKELKIPIGTALISQRAISSKFKISLTKINRILQYFQHEKQINIISNKHFTMVEIINYADYQDKNIKLNTFADEFEMKEKSFKLSTQNETANETGNDKLTNYDTSNNNDVVNINETANETGNGTLAEHKQNTSETLAEQSKERKKERKKEYIEKTLQIFKSKIETSIYSSELESVLINWILHRKEKGKPITTTTAEYQAKKINSLQNPIKAIEQSIEKDYAGIFESSSAINRIGKIQTDGKISYKKKNFI